ncbi:hypothetical protein CHU95_20125 [Niveispirillum lacus]|uniref:Uncharacterized protein n=2 Tax=Niveispirillum lacus TaxID=1981099 RepID=A0A255YQJ8_9PROT|nr:hypothetical protein CHU95_20125 [Niveispirillum lacus]
MAVADTAYVRRMRYWLHPDTDKTKLTAYVPRVLAQLAGADRPDWQRHDLSIQATTLAEDLGIKIISDAVWCETDLTVRRVDAVDADPDAPASEDAWETFRVAMTPVVRAAIADRFLPIHRPADNIAAGCPVSPSVYAAARSAMRALRDAGGELLLCRSGGDPRVAVQQPGAKIPNEVIEGVRTHLGACIEILEVQANWGRAIADGLATDIAPLIINAAMHEADRAASALSMTPSRYSDNPEGIAAFLGLLVDLDLLPTHIDPATGWPMPPDLARWLAAPAEVRAGWEQYADALRTRLLADHVVSLADLRAAGFDATIARDTAGPHISLTIEPIVNYTQEPDGWPGNRHIAEKDAASRKIPQDLWMRIRYSAARIAAELFAEAGDGQQPDYTAAIQVIPPPSMARGSAAGDEDVDAPVRLTMIAPDHFCERTAAKAFMAAARRGDVTRSEAIRLATDVAFQGAGIGERRELAGRLLDAVTDLAVRMTEEQELAVEAGGWKRLPADLDNLHGAAHDLAMASPIYALAGIRDVLPDFPEARDVIDKLMSALHKSGYHLPGSPASPGKAA